MVDVFKTNVSKKKDAGHLLDLLATYFPDAKINFDLQDTDRILRVHNEPGDPATVIKILNEQGFDCIALE